MKGPCDHCGVTESTWWRKGTEEKPCLCSSCGIRLDRKGTLEGYLPQRMQNLMNMGLTGNNSGGATLSQLVSMGYGGLSSGTGVGGSGSGGGALSYDPAKLTAIQQSIAEKQHGLSLKRKKLLAQQALASGAGLGGPTSVAMTVREADQAGAKSVENSVLSTRLRLLEEKLDATLETKLARMKDILESILSTNAGAAVNSSHPSSQPSTSNTAETTTNKNNDPNSHVSKDKDKDKDLDDKCSAASLAASSVERYKVKLEVKTTSPSSSKGTSAGAGGGGGGEGNQVSSGGGGGSDGEENGGERDSSGEDKNDLKKVVNLLICGKVRREREKEKGKQRGHDHAQAAPPASTSSQQTPPTPQEDQVYLTDVLKSVTVTGIRRTKVHAKKRRRKEDEDEDEDKSGDEDQLIFEWFAAEHSGRPSNCLFVDCRGLLPGSKVHITWEVKGRAQEFTVPEEIAKHLGMRSGKDSDTKTNIISRLWQHVEVKELPTYKEPASVEFTIPALQTFFTEEERRENDMDMDKDKAPPGVQEQQQQQQNNNNKNNNNNNNHTEIQLASLIGQKLTKCLIPVKRPSLECDVPDPKEHLKSDKVLRSLRFLAVIPSESSQATMTAADRLLKKMKSTRAVDLIDKDIIKMVEEINDRKKRRKFFIRFSRSPVEFMSYLIESQQKEFKPSEGTESKYPTSYAQRSHLFKDAWVQDATIRHLHHSLHQKS